jgi:hypothetical protein
MASSFTTNKNIEKPGYNDYASNPTGWSGPVNADWDIIDRAFGGVLGKSTNGSTPVNLNITETQNLVLIISGTLSANAVVTLPINAATSGIVAGQWIVKNSTTGSYTVTISPTSGGGTSVLIPQGETVSIFSDGTNVAFADNPSSYITAAFAARSVLAGTAMTGGGALSSNVTLNADQATDEDWRENVTDKLLNPNAVWAAMGQVALSDAAPVAWDMSLGFDFILTTTSVVGATRQIANPTNTKVGQKGRLIIQQDATGSRAVTWGSNYKFANGIAPVLSTTANATDVLYYDVRSSTYIIISLAGRAFA